MTAESQQQRIAQMLQRALPHLGGVDVVSEPPIDGRLAWCCVAWDKEALDIAALYFECHHERALDALEAAARVLADECIGPSEQPDTLERCHDVIRYLDVEICGAMDDRQRMRVERDAARANHTTDVLRMQQHCDSAEAERDRALERAEKAERELAELKERLAPLETAWRAQADSHHRHDVQAYCAGHADELRAAIGVP